MIFKIQFLCFLYFKMINSPIWKSWPSSNCRRTEILIIRYPWRGLKRSSLSNLYSLKPEILVKEDMDDNYLILLIVETSFVIRIRKQGTVYDCLGSLDWTANDNVTDWFLKRLQKVILQIGKMSVNGSFH